MKKYVYVCIFLSFITARLEASGQGSVEKPITVIVPSYNNAKWVHLNLDSIFSQNYTNYRVIYINDCSEDATGALVQEYLQKANYDYQVISFDESSADTAEHGAGRFKDALGVEKHFVTLVNNTVRSGALANCYRAIHSCDNYAVMATVDGDDWLRHANVFSELNQIYSSSNVWLTHGNLMEFPSGNVTWCEPVPPDVIESNTFRKVKCPSHLRTFYAWLFKKIELADLLYEGEFFPMAWDMAMMYPLIEMASERHVFVSGANYVYNMSNPINDNKVNAALQNHLDAFIRGKEPYSRIAD